MKSKLFNFEAIELTQAETQTIKKINTNSKDIAIIGVSGKFARANDLAQFWEVLREGQDCIGNFPESRKININSYLTSQGLLGNTFTYQEAGFLDEIDKFDYELFGITPKEASVMDPNQRLFLETVWDAIENAGYGGNNLVGSRTGIYVGYSTDSGHRYQDLVMALDPSAEEIALAGNINSIIASRIAYLLDFKGPSMLIDTACSSALVAVYMACQGIRNGECETAIAGSVKIKLFPLIKNQPQKTSLGIRSSTNRTKAFDDSSDGTGFGEGVGAVVLKSLDKALHDGDQVYAVIKGGAMNQDGSSIGMTAPNPAAQEELIIRAWQDAGIDPETISYIEAHGTGTKLGDPIEISGIEHAFQKYTMKKQFCAIGSVKSNIGHLDHAAGIASLIKVILMMQNQGIPPSLHFRKPNQKINFIEGPVYVNDRFRKWEKDGSPRRCGISSFGLSGTNCHLILEEAPPKMEEPAKKHHQLNILTLSAKNPAALLKLIQAYQDFLNQNRDLDLSALCYTANTGRGHYSHRLAFVCKDLHDLHLKISKIQNEKSFRSMDNGIFYGEHKIVPSHKEPKLSDEITQEQKQHLNQIADLKIQEFQSGNDLNIDDLCKMYVEGAEIEWRKLYQNQNYPKISLPGYPLQRRKCWIEFHNPGTRFAGDKKETIHPLIDGPIFESYGRIIYGSKFSVESHWIINEHKIAGAYVAPGTTFVEMARAVGEKLHSNMSIELTDVVFIKPLSVVEGEIKEVQTIITEGEDFYQFAIVSKNASDGIWEKHAEGQIFECKIPSKLQLNIAEIKAQCQGSEVIKFPNTPGMEIRTGPRWKCIEEFFLGENQSLLLLNLSGDYLDDVRNFPLHPALMDVAVNSGSRSIGEGLYLPWVYKSIKVYGKMPGRFYSHLRRKDSGKKNPETATYDVTLFDEAGHIFIEIVDYSIKKVHQGELRLGTPASDMYYEIGWTQAEITNPSPEWEQKPTLIFKGASPKAQNIYSSIQSENHEVIEVESGEGYQKVSNTRYRIGNQEADYKALFADINEKGITRIVHAISLAEYTTISNIEELADIQNRGLDSLYHLTRGLLESKLKGNIELIVISDYADEITQTEVAIKPGNSALLGFVKVIGQEYSNIHCKSIDIDNNTPVEKIIAEITVEGGPGKVAYRDGQRYVQEFREVDLKRYEPSKIPIKDQGVYIITGGTGGIGIEIAKYLAAKNRIKLAFISRSGLSDRAKWDEILERGDDRKLCAKLEAIREIEGTGTEVVCYSADVSVEAEITHVINELRNKYGKINGIIHSAGVAGDGFIIRKDKKGFDKVVNPKIKGTWLLDKLTDKDALDFFVMFSSVTSFLGGPGQGDYTAANAFLNSYALYMKKWGKKALTINWPAWKETGMAVDYGVNQDGSVFKAIDTKEAIGAFEAALNKDIQRMIAARLNYQSEDLKKIPLEMNLSPKLKIRIGTGAKKQAFGKSQRHEEKVINVALKGRADGGYTETERKLANIWAASLGFDTIDIYDSFFDLGGDSIFALKTANAINDIMTEKIRISDFFEHMTIHDLADYIDKQHNPSRDTAELIKGEEFQTNQEYELSSAQKRIWFLQKYDPGMIAYNLPNLSSIDYPLDIEVMNKSINALAMRHPILRTVFREGYEPKQIILDKPDLKVEYIDLTKEKNNEALMKQQIRAENNQPFDLFGTLFKIKVYELSKEKSCIYLNIHHLITDGWSLEIFAKELIRIYDSYRKGLEPDLKPVRPFYVEWAKQQNEWLESKEAQVMGEYWAHELYKPLPVLNLPTDFVRPGLQTYHGNFLKFRIDQNRTRKIKEIARRNNITPYMLMLSIYFVFLNKVTRDEDIIVGFPITGRDSKQFENVLGLFINTLCLRFNFSGLKTCQDLFGMVRKKSTEAYQNSKYPFDQIISKVNPERDLSRNPIYTTMYQFYDNIPPEVEGVSQFDISLLCKEMGAEIEARIEYNTDLFRPDSIERFQGYLQNIINQIIYDCQMELSRIELWTDEEQRRILGEFNNTETEYPQDKTISILFEEQVKRTPDQIALVFKDQHLSYRELNYRANQLAQVLRTKGMGPGQIAAIMVERSPEMLVGILAVLKTDGAYLPIDPAYPRERIQYMLADSGATLLLTQSRLQDQVDFHGERLNLEDEEIYRGNWTDVENAADSHNLAYVIYTSGSTGKPKGVMIEHRSFLNFIQGITGRIDFRAGKTILALAAFSFDMFGIDTLLPLCRGLKVVLAGEDEQRDPRLLMELIVNNKIEMIQTTPLRMQLLLLSGHHLSSLNRLTEIMIGGEAFPELLLEELKQQTTAKIYNLYGPTETTVWSTLRELTERNSIDIGKPIANTGIYILDRDQHPQPVGIPGELCIAGAGLARGYLNQPELNEERFVQNPFGEIKLQTSARLFKTGDLARWLPDGNIEFLGRLDHQVKIRGYRIELGEIENYLMKYETVKEAIVIARDDKQGGKSLCAYIVATKELNVSELRKHLSRQLPDYMIPSRFVQLEKLPLTPNGKIDRKALPEPEANMNTGTEYQAPTTGIEERLAAVWRDVLGVERIGIHDNFFDLGGNSFLVNLMYIKIEEEFRTPIKIIDIFSYPTIKKLAGFLEDDEKTPKTIEEELDLMFNDIRNNKIKVAEAVEKYNKLGENHE